MGTPETYTTNDRCHIKASREIITLLLNQDAIKRLYVAQTATGRVSANPQFAGVDSSRSVFAVILL